MQSKKEICDEFFGELIFANKLDNEEIQNLHFGMQEYVNQQSIDFGRWLLAEAEIVLDKDGTWLWNYDNKDLNTAELFEIYLKETNNE